MNVSRSAYYSWLKRPAKLITEQELMLYRRCKLLFNMNSQSAGARTWMKLLRKEGFNVGIYRVRRLMMKLSLVVKQRRAYKVTTLRKHSHLVADNLLDRQFNLDKANLRYGQEILPT
jgi:putative transposase